MKFKQTIKSSDLPNSAMMNRLPDGKHTVQITRSRAQKARSGKHTMCLIDMEDGSGRSITLNLNLTHPQKDTREIAMQQLGDLMRACGIFELQDTDDLIGSKLIVDVKARDIPRQGMPDLTDVPNIVGMMSAGGSQGTPVQTEIALDEEGELVDIFAQ